MPWYKFTFSDLRSTVFVNFNGNHYSASKLSEKYIELEDFKQCIAGEAAQPVQDSNVFDLETRTFSRYKIHKE